MAQHPPAGPFDAAGEALIFLHLPKTAGLSLAEMIRANYRRSAVFHVVADERSPRLGKYHGAVEAFRTLPARHLGRVRLLMGHFNFGLHEQFPGPASYVTVLRDPVDRFLSQMAHTNLMLEMDNPGHEPLTVEEFCHSELATPHLQTQMLCDWTTNPQVPDDVLESAKANLRTWFRVVGTVERMDETAVALAETLGWPPLPVVHQNASGRRVRKAELTAAERVLVEEKNALDIALYRYADRLLTERIEVIGRERCERLVRERCGRATREAGKLHLRDVYRRFVPAAVRRAVHGVRRRLNWV